MAKYLLLGEIDVSQLPTDLKERATVAMKFNEMIKQNIKDGKTTDWGVFVGGKKGYSVAEGTGIDLYVELQKFRPYVDFDAHQVLSIDEYAETFKYFMQ